MMDMVISRAFEARGRKVRGEGMTVYLVGLLDEAVDNLSRQMVDLRLSAELRSRLVEVMHQTWRVREGLNVPGRGRLGLDAAAQDAMPLSTRVITAELRAGSVCEAFADRCHTLSSRLADPARGEAAVVELEAGVVVLARAVGAPQAS